MQKTRWMKSKKKKKKKKRYNYCLTDTCTLKEDYSIKQNCCGIGSRKLLVIFGISAGVLRILLENQCLFGK
jgi:hypothetical protein